MLSLILAMAPFYMVVERATNVMVFLPVELQSIDITGLTQMEVNAAFASASDYIQVEESKMYMAIPYRTTPMQDPQCDNLLYVGRDLKGIIKALHDAVRKAARLLKLKKTSFVEEWD